MGSRDSVPVGVTAQGERGVAPLVGGGGGHGDEGKDGDESLKRAMVGYI